MNGEEKRKEIHSTLMYDDYLICLLATKTLKLLQIELRPERFLFAAERQQRWYS